MLILDELWCGSDNYTQPHIAFPAFLYEDSDLFYLNRVFTSHAIRATVYRLLMFSGLAQDRRSRDGVDPEAVRAMQQASPRQLAELKSLERPVASVAPDFPMPSLTLWPKFLAELDQDTRLVLFFSPLPIGRVPVPGSPAERRLEACKDYHRKIAATRPHTILIDRWVDDAFSRDIGNFSDVTHFRSGTAPMLEREIAAAMNSALRKP